MRLVVATKRNPDGWVVRTSSDVAGTAFDDFELRRSPAGFPIPDPKFQSRWRGKVHAPMCSGDIDDPVGSALSNVMVNDTEKDEITAFGNYLASVALGGNYEKAVMATTDGDVIEIELRVESDDPGLQRLPWEMMFHEDKPMVQHATRHVSIFRGIARTESDAPPAAGAARLRCPIRVLFVIGRQIDQLLRPWAEMMPLLRHLRVPVAGSNEFKSANLELIYLGEAAHDELEAAIDEHRPSVVHIASHGQMSADQKDTALLLSQREVPGDPASRIIAEPYRCSAERLLELMTHGKWLPSVVILNACHTADVSEPDERARNHELQPSFAARVVAGGVKVAVGMAGEVADRACQIFTVQFYRALLDEQSLTRATAHGRRAALLAYPDYENSVEWIRPTLFLEQGSSGILPLGPAVKSVSVISGQFRRKGFPDSLCDRYDFLVEYQDLLELLKSGGNRSPVVAFPVRDERGGVGAKRILEEIAARSLDDDFIPVLLRNEDNAPTQPLTFAVNVVEAMNQTRTFIREALGVAGPPGPSNCHKLAARGAKLNPNPTTPVEKAEFRRRLRLYLAGKNKPLPDMQLNDVRSCLEEDFKELINAVKAVTGRDHRLLVLLDDLHAYGDLAFAIIEAARDLGLASTGTPIPLLFTYMTRGGEGIGKRIESELNKRPDIRSVELKTFQESEELEMVCRQLLLSGYQRVFSTRPERRAQIDRCMKLISDAIDGRPINFDADTVKNYVDALTGAEVLVEADYESILRKFS